MYLSSSCSSLAPLPPPSFLRVSIPAPLAPQVHSMRELIGGWEQG